MNRQNETHELDVIADLARRVVAETGLPSVGHLARVLGNRHGHVRLEPDMPLGLPSYELELDSLVGARMYEWGTPEDTGGPLDVDLANWSGHNSRIRPQHAWLRKEQGLWRVERLSKDAEITLNGEPVVSEGRLLSDGDLLCFAHARYRVRICLPQEDIYISRRDMDGARTNDRDEDSITVYVCPVTGLEFVDVPEGDFEMGDLWGKGDADEQLRCRHRIGAFRLSRTLVTQSMWRDVMKSNPAEAYGEDFVGEEKPVVGVSLNDVQAFIKRLNEHIVRGRYRLPTEAEWEYAARSGGAEEQWPGTNQEEALERYAWFGISKVQPVGQKLPNGLGLYDMAGNVWEWTCSKYKERYDGSEVRCAHHDSGAARTVRGGSWHDKPHGVRTTDRDWNTPSIRCDDLGFRLVHEL